MLQAQHCVYLMRHVDWAGGTAAFFDWAGGTAAFFALEMPGYCCLLLEPLLQAVPAVLRARGMRGQ